MQMSSRSSGTASTRAITSRSVLPSLKIGITTDNFIVCRQHLGRHDLYQSRAYQISKDDRRVSKGIEIMRTSVRNRVFRVGKSVTPCVISTLEGVRRGNFLLRL